MNEPAPALESTARIWKACATALIVSLLILITVVLPAEFDIDPTGFGQLVGLKVADETDDPESTNVTAVAESSATDELAAIMAGNIIAAEPGAQKSYSQPFKSEVVSIPLAAFEEVEFKARMKKGDTVLYSWTSPQLMYVDMHGEPPTYPDKPAERYEEIDGVKSGHGRLTATFSGLHGWYWMNTSESDLVVELKISGYYDKLEEVYRSSQQE